MEDYEIYRDNYEYMRCSPMVQSLLRDNRELKHKIKDLKRVLRNKKNIKMETHGRTTIDLTNDEIEIKTIHLTSEPNIVYDLIECVDSDDDDGISDAGDEEEDDDASAGEDEDDADADEEDADADEEDADAGAEEEDEEDADDDASAGEADEEEEDANAGEDVGEAEAEDANAGEAEEDASAGEADEEEEGVYEVKIKTKTYYVTNETNGTIYAVASDGEVGDEVGKYVDGKPTFTKK
jgi:hypothetical protein